LRSLDTAVVGRRIFYHPALASTMDTARREAEKGAPEGTVIIAGEQTGGRGRLHRTWISPPGNIALSIILNPGLAGLPYLIMIASLAAASAIEPVADLKTQIKWPNDILIAGKKVGGILVENAMKGKKVAYSIVGIGINIDLNVAAHPEISDTAVSLETAQVKDDLRVRITKSLLTEFDRLYLKLPDGRLIYEAWRDRLVSLGKKVRVISGSQVIEGTAESVDETGTLLIRQPDGTLVNVIAGDVTLREK
jgi:BirA family biotin operon repressor/biotin-[acetyl-CoA-carboxylase] ligase